MTVGVFRFLFSVDITLDEAEMTLQLATFAAGGLFSSAQVRLDFSYHVDLDHRLILIDGNTEVSVNVAHIFTGLLLREFGEDSFVVERVHSHQNQPEEIAA